MKFSFPSSELLFKTTPPNFLLSSIKDVLLLFSGLAYGSL